MMYALKCTYVYVCIWSEDRQHTVTFILHLSLILAVCACACACVCAWGEWCQAMNSKKLSYSYVHAPHSLHQLLRLVWWQRCHVS